jgi:hypothetical protein
MHYPAPSGLLLNRRTIWGASDFPYDTNRSRTTNNKQRYF